MLRRCREVKFFFFYQPRAGETQREEIQTHAGTFSSHLLDDFAVISREHSSFSQLEKNLPKFEPGTSEEISLGSQKIRDD